MSTVTLSILMVLVSLALGLVLTLPILNPKRLRYLLVVLRDREKKKLGKLARRPLLLSYMERGLIHFCLWILPLVFNLMVMNWLIDSGNHWYSLVVWIVDTILILIYQQYRGQRFVSDAKRYLELTALGNRWVDGLIIDQKVPIEHQDAANWGHVIRVLGFRDVASDGTTHLLFVPFPVEQHGQLRSFSKDEAVRIFFRPKALCRGLPEEVVGSVVGVQRLALQLTITSWQASMASQAPRHS